MTVSNLNFYKINLLTVNNMTVYVVSLKKIARKLLPRQRKNGLNFFSAAIRVGSPWPLNT